MRAIVVGSGWGRHAAEALASNGRVELAAIVARGSSRSVELAQRLGATLETDIATAITSTRPALACVAVGERQHEEIVSALLDADCHVMCSHPVAPRAETVLRLADLAARRGRLTVTDYSLSASPRFEAFTSAWKLEGTLLRLAVEYPGRLLPMALDLSLRVAGPVRASWSSHVYPPVVDAAKSRSRAAFPPTIVIEHTSGVVTALTPIPHADPARAFRLVASLTKAQVTCELPLGATTVERLDGRGHFRGEAHVLADRGPPTDAFGRLMKALVDRFVGAAYGDGSVLPSFEEEARVRELWLSIWSGRVRHGTGQAG